MYDDTGVYSCQLYAIVKRCFSPSLPFTSFVSLNLWSINLNMNSLTVWYAFGVLSLVCACTQKVRYTVVFTAS